MNGGLMIGLSRRVGFRAGGGGLGNRRRRRSPRSAVSKSTVHKTRCRRTAYMITAPNTAPATAPPSFGSSSDPITMWLFDYRNSTLASIHPSIYKGPTQLWLFPLVPPTGPGGYDGGRTLNSDPIMERMTMANMDTTMLLPISFVLVPIAPSRPIYHVHAFMADTRGFTMVGHFSILRQPDYGAYRRR